MKRNHRIIGALAMGAVLTAGAGSALAFGPGGCDRMGLAGGSAMAAVYRLNDLTPDQKEKLKAVRDKVRKQQNTWREDRQALNDALLEGADATALQPLAEKQGKHVTERIMLRAQVRDEVNAILTEAQRAQLDTMVQSRGRRGGGPCMGR